MNAARAPVVDTLHALVVRFPVNAFDDTGFTEAALRDALDNAYPRERSLLVAAARQIPPSSVRTALAPDPATLARIDASALDARWAFDAWRTALDAPDLTQPTPKAWLPRAALALLAFAAFVVFGPRVVQTLFPSPVASPIAAPTDVAVSPSATPFSMATIAPFLFASPSVSALEQRTRCIDQWRAGRWSDARFSCFTASLLLPKDPLVQLGLGEAFVALNRNSEALAPLNAAIRLETDVIGTAASQKNVSLERVAYQNRGYAHYELGTIDRSADEYRQAKDDFNKSRSLGMLDSSALYFSADASYQLHAWCDAEQAYKKALEDPQLDPSYVKNAKRRAALAGAACNV